MSGIARVRLGLRLQRGVPHYRAFRSCQRELRRCVASRDRVHTRACAAPCTNRTTKYSSGSAVVSKQAAEAFSTSDASAMSRGCPGRQEQDISIALMVSLGVVMCDVLGQPSQRAFRFGRGGSFRHWIPSDARTHYRTPDRTWHLCHEHGHWRRNRLATGTGYTTISNRRRLHCVISGPGAPEPASRTVP